MIVAPPVEAGADHETVTCVLPETPLTEVGAPGSVTGVTEEEGAEAGLEPAAFVAVTLKL